jgi:hypothetical protein
LYTIKKEPEIDPKSDWSNDETFEFSKIKNNLKEERRNHRKSHKNIIDKLRSRVSDDDIENLHRYDVQINLKRMLYNDEKYIGNFNNYSILGQINLIFTY